MNYLKTSVQDGKVIIGQQCSETPDVALNYKRSFQELFDLTGKYPALLGLEYGYFANSNLGLTNQYAIDHWKKGGLITLSWHADCPWTDGYNVRWNSITNKETIHLSELLKDAPDSPARTNYRTELLKVGNALKKLKEQGVVVLWRPFHEMNGSWFWWGANHWKEPSNQPTFEALWKDMYTTFTTDLGLDNLLWVYSPNKPQGTASIISMYPGDAYVDIVALDNYCKLPEFDDYNALQTLNKLVVNGEIGPHSDSYGKFDQEAVLNSFKGKAAYFLQWHSWTNAKVAIKDNLRYVEMMNDPAAITLDKMKWKNE